MVLALSAEPSIRHGHVLLTMKVLNRNQELTVGFPMRGVRAQIASLLAALALAGRMQTGDQVAIGPPGDLDAMAYGQPAYYMSSRNAYTAATPVAYAAPVAAR